MSKININDPNITLGEILEDMVKYYSEDINRRCKIEDVCAYSGKTVDKADITEGCAIGRLLPSEFCIELDAKFKNCNIFSISHSDVGEQLPKIIKDNLDFFGELQVFHDCDDYWIEDGLSEAGEKRLSGIKYDYITK